MRILLMIAVIVMAPLFGTAFGITRDLTSYTIQRVWSDPASVYVVYTLHRAAVDGSFSDIHGTVTRQTQELRLARVSKKALARSGQITLEEGDTGTSLIYQDSDFELARIKEGAMLTTLSTRTNLPPCDAIWAATGAIRSAPGLFYCGTIYDTNGEVILRLPADIGIERTDRSHRAQKVDPLNLLNLAGNRFVVAFGQDSLMVVSLAQVKSSEGLTIKSWPMKGDDASSVTQRLVASNDGYLPQGNAQAYSPARIVLRPIRVEDEWILLCALKGCQQVTIPWTYSYVIVDEISRECILFRQQDLTKPVVEVRTISF
jgi:hypothetical protein